jgi:hypothetical protein
MLDICASRLILSDLITATILGKMQEKKKERRIRIRVGKT